MHFPFATTTTTTTALLILLLSTTNSAVAVEDVFRSNAVGDTLIDQVNFGSDYGGFLFNPQGFSSTSGAASYSKGRLKRNNLEIILGGRDNAVVVDMSACWEETFTLESDASLRLQFQYKLIQAKDYERDEYSDVLVSVDDQVVTEDPLVRLRGNGNGGNHKKTRKQTANVDLTLEAGMHTICVGAYNNQKSLKNEWTKMIIYNVKLWVTNVISVPPPTVGSTPSATEESTTPSTSEEITATSATEESPAMGGAVEFVNDNVLGGWQDFKANVVQLASFGDRSLFDEARPWTSYTNAERWVYDQLEGWGYTVERHNFVYRNKSRSSMYVTKVGTVHPDEMYIVSAHLDGRGGGGGADDDASGCSLVLLMAKAMADPSVTVETSVRFIFWANEETGLNGSYAYVDDRKNLQGKENPAGSGLYPEPKWKGMIQHDMILYDHGVPGRSFTGPDADVEYRRSTTYATQSRALAEYIVGSNAKYANDYPAQVGSWMQSTDSHPFRNYCPSVSIRENRRGEEIGYGSNPHYHRKTDVATTYSNTDYQFGYSIVKLTAGSVAELVNLQMPL